jgi:Aminoglycoside adenylyltransferase, C-terminal domain
MVPGDVAAFGDRVAEVLESFLAADFVGAYFVGSIALGGFVPGESDIDIVAACEHELPLGARRALAGALSDTAAHCPTRGLELTLYRRAIASATPVAADFELNVNGGPRMEAVVRVTPDEQPAFWYVLDRAIARRHGVLIQGAPAANVFADVPRAQMLGAMRESMRWHRTHERATLYSVLNAARAWRFAEEDILGSKLDGARWARKRWRDPALIDAAVDLRHGRPAHLEERAVNELLDHVEQALEATEAAERHDIVR